MPSYADVLKVVLIAAFGKSKVADLVNMLSGKTSKKGEISKRFQKKLLKLGAGVKAFVSQKNFQGFFTGAGKKQAIPASE